MCFWGHPGIRTAAQQSTRSSRPHSRSPLPPPKPDDSALQPKGHVCNEDGFCQEDGCSYRHPIQDEEPEYETTKPSAHAAIGTPVNRKSGHIEAGGSSGRQEDQQVADGTAEEKLLGLLASDDGGEMSAIQQEAMTPSKGLGRGCRSEDDLLL